MPVVFLTQKHYTTIKRVEVLEILPRHVVVKVGNGHRRERRETLFHRYHLTFADAKRYLAATWRLELKKAKERYHTVMEWMTKIDNLTETDL